MSANTAAHAPARRPGQQRTLLLTVALCYVSVFLVWRLLVATPLYATWWWLEVSEIFGLFAYLPLPLLLGAALIQRQHFALLALLLPLLWFGAEYGTSFIPRAPAVHADGEAPTLRVMTWNVKREIGFRRNAVNDLLTLVEGQQPDFIFLQEAGPDSPTHLQPLIDTWPYQIAGIAGGRVFVAFASKWPIVAGEVVEDLPGCNCIRMTIDWQGQLVDVLVVHVSVPQMQVVEYRGFPILAGFDTERQDHIFDALLAEIAASPRPIIVAGDFNTNEREPNYARMLAAGMHNAYAEAGWGFGLTFPRPGAVVPWVPFALIRIDHIFYNDAWVADHAWTGTSPVSDHLYLSADLRLRNSP